MARILKEPRLGPEKPGPNNQRWFPDAMERRGPIVREYAEMWDGDASSPEAVSRRVEEIAFVVTVLYGVGGWKEDWGFTADFFL
jgi:Questin oxidase-like